MRIAFIVCTAFLVIFGAPTSRSAMASDPDIEEIIARLDDWKSSFTTLRIVYEVHNPGQWLFRKPELAESGDLGGYYRQYEFLYTDNGRNRLECLSYEGGRLARRRLGGNDGRIAYIAKFEGGDLDDRMPEELLLQNVPVSGRPGLGDQVMPLKELWRPRGDWLGRVFNRPEAVRIRYGEIDGVRCVGIRRSPDSVHTLWLDLEHDYLPRLQEPDPGIDGWRFHVHEFLKLNNGRWFPKRGTQTAGSDSPNEWRVLEAVVNEPVSPDQFRPPRPGPKTRVWDSTGPTPKLPQGDQDSQAASQLSPPPTNSIRAAPTNYQWLWVTLLIVSGALLVIGVWLQKRS